VSILRPPGQGFTAIFTVIWLTVLWATGPLAPGAPAVLGPEEDCEHPAEARAFIARLRLAEIEGAEDIHREAMWQAFGRCPPGTAGVDCRTGEQRRFDARWEVERREIEAKYRDVLGAFERRCRAVISRIGWPIRAVS
jgi:hypothetical protein